ncbi:MAG: WhiB family transcriptional regulator [Brachybacterium tyrofermentans]
MSPLIGWQVPAVPSGGEGPWERLARLVQENPEPVPCAGPEAAFWYGEAAEQHVAADACLDCPLMVACDAYATAAGEWWGVWGGLTQRERRRAGRAGRAKETA